MITTTCFSTTIGTTNIDTVSCEELQLIQHNMTTTASRGHPIEIFTIRLLHSNLLQHDTVFYGTARYDYYSTSNKLGTIICWTCQLLCLAGKNI